jgi:hypothetical protein
VVHFEVEFTQSPVMPPAMMPGLATSLLRIKLSSIIPVDRIISIGGPVSLYFSADTGMVLPDTTTDFSERESGNRHMTDNVALFSGKMMVGHDGLLSGSSVGGASLYQKTPSCPPRYFTWCSCK